MARQISRAEAWERAHEIFTQVNFSAFDYNSIKESLLDYVKLYFPEDFNDYIESSEFIAILELFAYIGELLSYRLDLNAHENFITTAQRKESILRLAKMISYKVSRNIPARGLVKITSIQTTETLIDSSGRNLAGRRIFWNDNNNSDWKEQFLLVINRVLEQEFGSVDPDDRAQVDDVLFELYTLNNNPLTQNGRSVLSYTASSGGESVPMELVPIQLTPNGPIERRPEVNAKFSVLFANDGLGDSSDTTGFMMFTKQGTLAFQTQTFDGVTPNQTFDLTTDNINETDLWLNNVNANTGAILTDDPYENTFPHLVAEDLRYGEWIEVDLANAQNIMFNTNKNRHKYEVETLDNDQVRLIFGDGEFSEIPAGTFHVWYRTSANEDLYVEKNSVIDKPASFTYTDLNGSVQTITLTFSLVSSLQNASASEDIEHIRRVAPSVYYTQDRMVNGRDYNTFMLQDPSILRLRAINRTFAGDSKYIAWHDPRENYEDVKMFGDDLALYWAERDPSTGGLITVPSTVGGSILLFNYIEPLLSSTDVFAVLGSELQKLGENPGKLRRTFNQTEVTTILAALDTVVNDINTDTLSLYYSVVEDEWTVAADYPDSILMITAKINSSGWDVRWRTRRMIAHSEDTRFWNTNDTLRVVNFDTLNSVNDTIVVLEANKTAKGDGLLTENKEFPVLAQELTDQQLPGAGLPDIHRLSVLPVDINEDGIPDDLLQAELFESEYDDLVLVGSPPTLMLSRSFNTSPTKGLDLDVEVYVNGTQYTFASDVIIPGSTDLVTDSITFDPNTIPTGSPITIRVVLKNYVYFTREDTTSPWVPVQATDTIRTLYMLDDGPTEDALYRRELGQYPLNFAWFHHTPRFNLVDPAASNIIDMFIITAGYYTGLRRWLSNKTDVRPVEPTPLELRASYSELLDNKMISDTVVLHSGKFKILFGSRAIPQLRCTFKVIRPEVSSLTDNQVTVRIVEIVRSFFDIDSWDFGETFYFTELAAAIHVDLGPEIDSVVLVPTYAQNQFGDMFQVRSREDELFVPDISTSNIEIIQSLTPSNIRQN